MPEKLITLTDAEMASLAIALEAHSHGIGVIPLSNVPGYRYAIPDSILAGLLSIGALQQIGIAVYTITDLGIRLYANALGVQS